MPAYDKRMLNNQRLTKITQLMLLTNKYFDEIMIMTDRSRSQLTIYSITGQRMTS